MKEININDIEILKYTPTYKICRCPECNENEAFMYNQSNILKCNRENECGATFNVQGNDNKKEIKKIEDPLKKERKNLNDFINTTINSNGELSVDKKTEELRKELFKVNNIRGISSSDKILDIQKIKEIDEDFYNGLKKFINPFINDFEKRSSIILLYNTVSNDTKIERLLVRDDNLNTSIKEKQINLNPVNNKSQDFFIDKGNDKSIYICEGVYDALSIKEIKPNSTVVGLTGVRKQRQIIDYLEKNKNEYNGINICFDNDTAGKKGAKELNNKLGQKNINSNEYIFGNSFSNRKDLNELLINEELKYFLDLNENNILINNNTVSNDTEKKEELEKIKNKLIKVVRTFKEVEKETNINLFESYKFISKEEIEFILSYKNKEETYLSNPSEKYNNLLNNIKEKILTSDKKKEYIRETIKENNNSKLNKEQIKELEDKGISNKSIYNIQNKYFYNLESNVMVSNDTNEKEIDNKNNYKEDIYNILSSNKISKENKEKELESLYNDFFSKKENIISYITATALIDTKYSSRNQSLLYLQKPDIKELNTLKNWSKEGVKVNKGEKGLYIMIPTKNIYYFDEQDNKYFYYKNATDLQKEKVKNGEVKTIEKEKFIYARKVFDISQTNKEVKLKKDKLNEEQIYQGLLKFMEKENIIYKEEILNEKGVYGKYQYSNSDENIKIIKINKNLTLENKIKTITHELGHYTFKQNNKKLKEKELEAELFSYFTSSKLGIDPSLDSLEYLKDHNIKPKEIIEKIDEIKNESDKFIKKVKLLVSNDTKKENKIKTKKNNEIEL